MLNNQSAIYVYYLPVNWHMEHPPCLDQVLGKTCRVFISMSMQSRMHIILVWDILYNIYIYLCKSDILIYSIYIPISSKGHLLMPFTEYQPFDSKGTSNACGRFLQYGRIFQEIHVWRWFWNGSNHSFRRSISCPCWAGANPHAVHALHAVPSVKS